MDRLVLGEHGGDKDEELDDERVDQEERGSFSEARGGHFSVEQEMEAREGLCKVLGSLDERFKGEIRGGGGRRGRGEFDVERGDFLHGLEETVKKEVDPLLKVLGL